MSRACKPVSMPCRVQIASGEKLIAFGLSEKDAEYHLLLKKANDRFNGAVRKVQKNGSYDIIAEDGAISCKNCTATDITSDVIAALP